MKIKAALQFIICLAIPLGTGLISGFITRGEVSGEWFSSLEKPSFNPPSALFAPVWTSLYILMGIAFFIIYKTPPGKIRKKALITFFAQLFLNFLWSILFFSIHSLIISAVDIIILWILIIRMIIMFGKLKPVAGYLQIPYLFWVGFASVLNITIAYLNLA